jgi:hypothetical protein
MAVLLSAPLVCGPSDVRVPFNRHARRMFHLPGGVVDLFRWASAQHVQAAEYGGEKEAARGCGGMPLFMVVHGDCSGVTTALKTMCLMARTDALRIGGVYESDDSSGSRTRAMPCSSTTSTVVMEIECKARGKPVLSELSQKFDGVLKRCGERKRAALASVSCGIDSRYHTRALNEKRQRRAPGHLLAGASQRLTPSPNACA